MRYFPWFRRSGKVKAKVRAKDREHAVIVVRAITTAETARMTNRTTAGETAEHLKNQQGRKADKDPGTGWDAGKSNYKNLATARAKEKTGRGMASHNNDKVRADRTTGTRHRGKVRAA